MDTLDKTQFTQFVTEIKTKIREAQLEALQAVNKRLIDLYWNLGKMIVERQEAHGWGKSVVERLSVELQLELTEISGYSAANLWRMRNFYLIYRKNEFLAPLVREIGWSHNIIIFEKCKDDLQREFYLRMTKKFGWIKNVLIHQVENQSYEKYLLNQTSFDQTLPESLANQAKLAVKDEYTFDFLGLSEEHSEYELEFDRYLCPSKNDRHATRCKHLYTSFCTSAYRNGLCSKSRRGQTQRRASLCQQTLARCANVPRPIPGSQARRFWCAYQTWDRALPTSPRRGSAPLPRICGRQSTRQPRPRAFLLPRSHPAWTC